VHEYESAAPAAQPVAPAPAGPAAAITPSVVLAMQRTAGNRAVTGRLQRNNSGQVAGPAAGRPVRSDASPAQGPPAGWADPSTLAGGGSAGDDARRPDRRRRPGVLTAQIRTSATVSCDDHLPLPGSSTAHIEGTMTASRGHLLSPAERQAIETRASDAELRNQLVARLGSARRVRAEAFDPDEVYSSFAGTMHWYDRWDFDPHVPAAPGSPGSFPQQRTPDAEEGVRHPMTICPGRRSTSARRPWPSPSGRGRQVRCSRSCCGRSACGR
jgi:hypothetical protein